jgi:hypothetical protein
VLWHFNYSKKLQLMKGNDVTVFRATTACFVSESFRSARVPEEEVPLFSGIYAFPPAISALARELNRWVLIATPGQRSLPWV